MNRVNLVLLNSRKNQSVLVLESLCAKNLSGSGEDDSVQSAPLHELEPFGDREIEHAFCQSVRTCALWSDYRYADDGVFIFPGVRIYEVVIGFFSDIPVSLVAAGSGNGSVLECHGSDRLAGEGVLYADSPTVPRFSVFPACEDIPSRIDEKIPVSERAE